MNKITDKEIKDYLQKQTDNLIQEYGKSIIGTFVIGNANYGFADNINEIFIVALYAPTFEELCFGGPFHKYDRSNRIVIDDIRHVYTAEIDIWKDYLELANSKYYYLTEQYKRVFTKMLLEKRDLFATINPRERVRSAAARALECHEEKPLEASRLMLAAMEYSKGTPIWDCFHLDSNPAYDSFLNGVKEGICATSYETLKKNLDQAIAETEDKPNPEAAAALKQGVIAIVEESLHSNVHSDAFCSCLTDTERKALKAIIQEIGEEGNITITKIVDSTGISRPVYTNLITKMKTHSVAEITNQGMKGTKIKILDRRLLKI